MGALKMLAAALVAVSVATSAFQSPWGAGDELVAMVVGGSFVLGCAISRIIFVYNHR